MKIQKHIHYIFVAALITTASILLASRPAVAGLNSMGKCVPTTELCNGVDDNCDGVDDSGLTETQACGSGACQGTRTRACITASASAMGGMWGPWGNCSGRTPSAEVCDGLDNDCDGRVDEGMRPQFDPSKACQERVCQGAQGWQTVAANAGDICRSASGACDVAESCDGVSVDCPIDGFAPATTVCHAASDQCDVEERCLGTNPDCPPNSRAPDGGFIICGVGECKREVQACTHGRLNTCTPGAPKDEVCDGLDNDCDGQVDENMPAQTIPGKPCQQLVCMGAQGWQPVPANAGTVCHPSSGVCDVAEACIEGSAECPADTGSNGCSIGGVCHPNGAPNPANACEKCNSTANSNAWTAKANGASCDDGNKCTSHDSCQGGSCAGTAISCSPIDACHVAGTCNPLNGECTAGAAINCDDGDLCTIDSCNNALGCKNLAKTCAAADRCHLAGTCSPLNGECTAGTEISCAPADACHAAESCNMASGLCEGGAEISCDDGDACTTDSCAVADGGCVHARIDGCGIAEGCTPGNSRPCADIGTGGCNAEQMCRPDRTWGECAFDESQICEDLAVIDTECSVPDSGRCSGSANNTCVYQNQALFINDDNCCPPGGNNVLDNDCESACGNAIVEAGETCEALSPDRPCTERCDDSDAGTRDERIGSTNSCNVQCRFTPITECANGDGFCPAGCLFTNDNDCAGCGNGIIEAQEACDGAGCAEGSSCNSECACVAGAVAAVCGNGRIEAPEACDGTGCAEGSSCNSECACVEEASDGMLTFMTICEGASPKTKAANEEIRAAVPGLTGDRICDAEIARIIFILSFVPDPNLDPSNLNANTLPFALLQTGGHLVVKTDQNWKEREYRVLGSPTIIMAQRNIMESRSPASSPSQLAGLLSSYAVPPDFKAIGDEQGIINRGGSLTYELRVTSAEPNFPLTLGNGEILSIANPAASSVDRKIVHTIITAVAPGTASVIAEGGPNVEEVKNVEDRLYNVANIIAAGGGRGAEWEPGDKLEFTLLQSKGSGDAIEMYPTVYAVRGDWGDGGDESGFACALMTISKTDVPAAIFILLLIAILPAGALSLARAVVKNRWMKK